MELGTGLPKPSSLLPSEAAAELRRDREKSAGVSMVSDEKGKSRVKIEIQMNGYVFIFGVPLMITLIILGTITVFYFVGSSHHAQLAMEQARQQAKVSTNPFLTDEALDKMMARLPEIAEHIRPEIKVNVEPSKLPAITVPEIKIPEIKVPEAKVYVQNATPEAPHVTVQLEGGQPAPKTVTRVVEKVVEKEMPVYVETQDGAVLTMDDMYPIIERYVEDFCKKNSLDANQENAKWLKTWQERIQDSGGDEQRLANRVLIEKRGSFNVEKAQPEQVVDMCRLMLRYRDARLALPSIFKEFVTADRLVQVKRFLESGVAMSPAAVVK